MMPREYSYMIDQPIAAATRISTQPGYELPGAAGMLAPSALDQVGADHDRKDGEAAFPTMAPVAWSLP